MPGHSIRPTRTPLFSHVTRFLVTPVKVNGGRRKQVRISVVKGVMVKTVDECIGRGS